MRTCSFVLDSKMTCVRFIRTRLICNNHLTFKVLIIFWDSWLAWCSSVSCRESQNSLNAAGTGKTQKTEPNDADAAKKTKSAESARLTEADKANTGKVWVHRLCQDVRTWLREDMLFVFGQIGQWCLLCRWSYLCFGSTWRLSACPCPSSVSFCSSVIICPLWAQTTGSVSGQMTLLSTTPSPTERCV